MNTKELADALRERILSAPGCGPEVQQSLDKQSDDDLIWTHCGVAPHISLNTAKELASDCNTIPEWFDLLYEYRGSGIN